ncbi:iron chelate uptake ABC transporter family permease subunit [Corynebacterium sp. H128]|uniref:FecCD family ABC transporter permease n=1 Tax=Corynebacterium sp. H128 TaxID=3133427 RepID=UPI0030A46044
MISPLKPMVLSRAAGMVPAALLCLAALAFSLCVGARDIPLEELLKYLRFPAPEDPVSQVVWSSRVPRTVLILLGGAAFGVAGALMQAVTRNPLTDPGILGVNAGASLAVVLGLAFFGLSDVNHYMWWSLVGALVTSVAVFAIGNSGQVRGNPIKFTLAGVALGAVMGGLSRAILLSDSALLERMRGWSAGTTASQSLANTLTVAPVIGVGLLLALALYRALDVLALGDASAIAMGAKPVRIRLLSLCAIALLAGGATAVMGPVGFIGLLTPHLARLLVGPHQGWILTYSILLAPTILGFADVLGRVAVAGEIPVGVVTPFIGGPLLVYLVLKMRVSTS